MTSPWLVPADAVVGVVGAGTMGAGIAEVAARAGHPVRLLDAVEGAAARALERIAARLDHDVARGRLDPGASAAVQARLQATTSVDGLSGAGVVVEAVVEDAAVKRRLLADLELVVQPRALLASNSSSLPVTALATGLHHPERVLGLHFFNPAPRMRLVEVVRGDATDDGVVDAGCELARAWGKTPVVCASTPGFVVNRVARPFYGEAQRMVEEGVADPATVDALLREAGGFPMGPFELTDLVGQDVNLAVSRSVWEQTFHDARYAPTVLQQRLVDAGRLGRKCGRGVYRYEDGRPVDAAPATEAPQPPPSRVQVTGLEHGEFAVMGPFLDRARAGGVDVVPVELDLDADDATTGVALPGGGVLQETVGAPAAATWGSGDGVVLLDWAHDPRTCTRVALAPSPDCPPESVRAAVGLCQAAGVAVSVVGDSPGLVVARTVAMLVNEAVELVRRREASATDVDVAMILGTGYPSGPLEWGDRLGPTAVQGVVEALHDVEPSGRYRASPLLARLAFAEGAMRAL